MSMNKGDQRCSKCAQYKSVSIFAILSTFKEAQIYRRCSKKLLGTFWNLRTLPKDFAFCESRKLRQNSLIWGAGQPLQRAVIINPLVGIEYETAQ